MTDTDFNPDNFLKPKDDVITYRVITLVLGKTQWGAPVGHAPPKLRYQVIDSTQSMPDRDHFGRFPGYDDDGNPRPAWKTVDPSDLGWDKTLDETCKGSVDNFCQFLIQRDEMREFTRARTLFAKGKIDANEYKRRTEWTDWHRACERAAERAHDRAVARQQEAEA